MSEDDDTETRTMTAWKAIDQVVATLCEIAEELEVMPRERFDGGALAQKLWEVTNVLEGAQDRGDEENTRVDPEAVISALRLAMYGSDNDATRVRAVEALLDYAPPTPPKDTEGPGLLCDTIRNGILATSMGPA